MSSPPADRVRPEFAVHRLNEAGMAKATKIAEAFSTLLTELEETTRATALSGQTFGGREMALVRTHLEEAAFYAKRAMAMKPENQEGA